VSPIRTRRQLLARMDAAELTCRARGHQWPELDLGSEKLPPGMEARRRPGGVFLIEETCLRCGKARTMLTAPRGIFDLDAVRRYTDPEHWTRLPAEAGVTRRDIVAEYWRQAFPMIRREAITEEVS